MPLALFCCLQFCPWSPRGLSPWSHDWFWL